MNSYLFATVIAALSACATLAIAKFAVLSNNVFIAVAQRIVVMLLMPGMIASTVLAGNAHTFNVWIAAGLNALLYFAIAWLLFRLTSDIAKRGT